MLKCYWNIVFVHYVTIFHLTLVFHKVTILLNFMEITSFFWELLTKNNFKSEGKGVQRIPKTTLCSCIKASEVHNCRIYNCRSRKIPASVSLFNKVAGFLSYNFIKKMLQEIFKNSKKAQNSLKAHQNLG